MRRVERVFAVFEGGGARGIAHLGVCAALEKWEAQSAEYKDFPKLEMQGYGGTSIGALIAPLKCLGLRSSQLYEPKTKKSELLEKLGINSPPKLFGRRLFGLIPGWWLIKTLSALLTIKALFILIALSFAMQFGLYYLTTMEATGSHSALIFVKTHGFYIFPLLFFGPLFLPLIIVWLGLRGLCSTQSVEAAINLLLAEEAQRRGWSRPACSAVERFGMTFAHLKSIGAPPLKVVATDIDNKRLQLFSYVTTPNASVAKAVVASMAMPIAFEPVTIDFRDRDPSPVTARYFDGGLTSNLPVWAFNSERELDPDASTLAIEIGERSSEIRTNWIAYPFSLAFNTAYTTIFGARELEKGQSRRVIEISVAPNVEVLEFDLSAEKAASEMREAEMAACRQLTERYLAPQKSYLKICHGLTAWFQELVDAHCKNTGQPSISIAGRLRVSVAARAKGLDGAVKIIYGYGFGNGTLPSTTDGLVDDRLLLPLGSHIGLPFIDGNFHVTRGAQDAIDKLKRATIDPTRIPTTHRYEQHLIWSEMQWALCVPLRRRGSANVDLTVTIDSSMQSHHLPILTLPTSDLQSLSDNVAHTARDLLDSTLPSE